MSKSVGELRAELKALRKEHPDHKPVSKMKKNDIADVIERMSHKKETTPSIALDKVTRIDAMEKKAVRPLKADKVVKENVKEVKHKVKEHKEKEMVEHKEPKVGVADRMAKIRAMKGKK
jgi:lysyl-tRNA synthetase class II